MGNIRLVSSKGRKNTVQRPREYRQPEPPPKAAKVQREKRERKRGSAARTFITIVLIILVGCAALVLALGFYVRSLDTIFPNVWADGIELSGMTMEEAVDALIAAGYERNAEDVSATVRFPNDASFTISGNDAGFALNAYEAAEAAFRFGREGTYFENDISFVRAHFSRTDLREVSRAGFDEDFVRSVVAEHTNAFNLALIDDAYTIGTDSITIEVGTGIQAADMRSVHEFTVQTLFQALDEQAHLTVLYTPEELYVYDVDLQVLYDAISVAPVSAVYDPETFSATQSSTGVTFDMDVAMSRLYNAQRGEVIVIPLIVTEPEMSTEELNSMLFRDVLSERTTPVSGTAARRHNVALSAEYVNETKLNPGELFSFNQTVGRRTTERGFRPAGAFVNGRLVDQPGGGICQTSSTLYYAALIANLQIVERREHGLTVGYIALGHDATVAWGQIDFRMRNNRDFPIMIETVMENNRLTARIIGTRVDDYTFTTDFTILSRTPFEEVRQEDPDIAPGSSRVDLAGSTGFVVEVFVSRLDAEGYVVDRWSIGRSTYRVQNRVILVAPEEPPHEGTAPPETPPGEQTPPPYERPPTQPPTEQPPLPPEEPYTEPPQDDVFPEAPPEETPQQPQEPQEQLSEQPPAYVPEPPPSGQGYDLAGE